MLEQYHRPLHSHLIIKTRQWFINSPLHRFGIHQRRSVRWITAPGGRTDTDNPPSSAIIFTSCDLSWQLLGYGIRWSQRYPYGNILPALRIFPLVPDLNLYENFICHGTIHDIQQGFRSGVIHPFSKDMKGFTFLHVRCTFLCEACTRTNKVVDCRCVQTSGRMSNALRIWSRSRVFKRRFLST